MTNAFGSFARYLASDSGQRFLLQLLQSLADLIRALR